MKTRGNRRGLSLVEVVVSAALVGVVLASSAHVLSVKARSTEGVYDRIAPQLDASRIAGRIRDELAAAISITSADATSISFVIPDRDADASDEAVSYSFSSDQITRDYNGVSSVLMSDVDDFRLGYRQRLEQQQSNQGTVDSGEVELASHDGYSGYFDWFRAFALDQSDQVAQYFEVQALPEGTISFDITRVKVRARRYESGSTGLMTVTMERPQDANPYWPDGTVLDQASIDVTTMSSSGWAWYDLYFSSLTDLSPGDNAFTMRLVGGSTTNCRVSSKYVLSPPGPDDGMQIYWTDDGGVTWDPNPTNDNGDLRFYLYGEYTTATTVEQTVNVPRVTGVQIEITPQDSDRASARFARLLNEPEYDLGIPDDEDAGFIIGDID